MAFCGENSGDVNSRAGTWWSDLCYSENRKKLEPSSLSTRSHCCSHTLIPGAALTHVYHQRYHRFVCSYFSYNSLDYHLGGFIFPGSCCGVDHRLRDRRTNRLYGCCWIDSGPTSLWLTEQRSRVRTSVIFSLPAVSDLIQRNINTLLGAENHWAMFNRILMVISLHVNFQSKWGNFVLWNDESTYWRKISFAPIPHMDVLPSN